MLREHPRGGRLCLILPPGASIATGWSGAGTCLRLAEMGLGLLLPVLAPRCPFPSPSCSTGFPPHPLPHPALAVPCLGRQPQSPGLGTEEEGDTVPVPLPCGCSA